MKIMIFVTDTHSLCWFLSQDRHLSENARNCFLDAEKGESMIIVPTIVMAELFWILERKKQYLLKFNEALGKIISHKNYSIVPLTLTIIENLSKMPEEFELHDSFLVLTSQIYDAKLITKDEIITKSGIVDTIW